MSSTAIDFNQVLFDTRVSRSDQRHETFLHFSLVVDRVLKSILQRARINRSTKRERQPPSLSRSLADSPFHLDRSMIASESVNRYEVSEIDIPSLSHFPY